MVRRIIPLLLLALLVASPAGGQGVEGRKAAIDDKIASLNDKIAVARERERELAGEIAQVSAQIRNLEHEVGDVSSDLVVLERNLALYQAKLDRLTELFQLQSRKLAFLRDQYATAVHRLHARLVAIYEGGRIGTVEVLLAAESFSDLLSRLEYVREIAAQDRRIAAQVEKAKLQMRAARLKTKKTRAQVARVTRAVAIRTQQQRALRDRLVSSRDALAGTRNEKERTLETVKENKDEYIAEVEALARVSAQLAARIQSAQSSSSSSRGSAAPAVVSSSGFIWPVSGPVTSPFGWRWGRMHEGIDIAAPSGTPIRAAASGVVIYAGWMGGYGNLVVVDHGGGVATAYAHASAIAVGNGQSVAQGQVVSYVGCTGHCFGAHLHFEVRVNGAPVDPLGYL
jgi:murein DD-endopeptidase MepM/ murein hydrolase activator NlpD